MAWTGDTLSVLTEILNERPMDDVVESMGFRNAIYNRIMKTSREEDFYGEYAKLLIHTTAPMNAVPRVEGGLVVLPGADVFKELHIKEAQYMASVGWTQEEIELAVRKKGSALIDLVNLKLKNAPLDLRYKLNLAFMGDGTGRLCRLSAAIGGAGGSGTVAAPYYGTCTVDNTTGDFGIVGTSHLRNGMLVDIYTIGSVTTGFPTGATFTKKVIGMVVSDITGTTFKITQTQEADYYLTTLADDDVVFVHDSINVSGTTFVSWNGSMGLYGIVDGGGCAANEFTDSGNLYNGSFSGVSFQGLSRTTYPQLKARVARADTWGAGTAGTAMACDLGIINAEIRKIDEESETGGEVTALYMNGATRDWMAGLAYAQQNAFVQVTGGKIIPGMPNITGFRSATGRIIPVIPASQMPDGHIMGGDERDLILFQSVPLDWYTGMGSKSFPSPGTRDLTFESWLRTKCMLAARRCDNWFRLEDIDLTA